MKQDTTTRKTTKTEEGNEESKIKKMLSEEEAKQLKRSIDKKEWELKRGQRQLELDRKRLQHEREAERARLANENQLFAMKWKLLEEEVKKLAKDRQEVERQKLFLEQDNAFGRRALFGTAACGEVFFAGVTSELALKKRYRDLIKIYHPDNLSGDTGAIQEINREYDQLKDRMEKEWTAHG